jgi:hypothetical protein
MKCDNQPRSSDVVPPLGGLKTAQPPEGGTTNTFSMTGFERQNSSVLWQLSNRVFVIPAPRFRPRVPPAYAGVGQARGNPHAAGTRDTRHRLPSRRRGRGRAQPDMRRFHVELYNRESL